MLFGNNASVFLKKFLYFKISAPDEGLLWSNSYQWPCYHWVVKTVKGEIRTKESSSGNVIRGARHKQKLGFWCCTKVWQQDEIKLCLMKRQWLIQWWHIFSPFGFGSCQIQLVNTNIFRDIFTSLVQQHSSSRQCECVWLLSYSTFI